MEQNISSDKTDEFLLEDDLSLDDDLLEMQEDELLGDDDLDIEEYVEGDEPSGTQVDLEDDTNIDLDIEDDIEADAENETELLADNQQTHSLVGKLKGAFGKLKIKKKRSKAEKLDDSHLDDESTHVGNNESQTVKMALSKKLPFLAKIINKKKNDPLNSHNVSSTDEEIEDSVSSQDGEGKETKKKFQLKKIHAIVIVLIVFLALNWEEEAPSPVIKTPKKKAKFVKGQKRPEPVKPIEPVEVKQEKVETVESFEASTDDDTQVVEQTAVTDEVTQPQNNLDELKLSEEELTTTPVIKPDEVIIETEKNVVDTVDLTQEITELKNENINVESEPETSIIAPSEEDNNSMFSDIPSENTSDIVVESDISTDITKKLLEDLEVKLKEEKEEMKMLEVLKPVGAPSYETIGYGLVYNCQGGHWACIEATGYKQCRQNYSWNKSQDVAVDCYPYATLDNEEDCSTVQQEKIDSVSKTEFCK